MTDNKIHNIPLPVENPEIDNKFKELIIQMRQFKIDSFEQTNKKISNLYDAITELGLKPELKEQLNALERTRDKLGESLQKAQSYQPPKINKEKLKKAYTTLSNQYSELSQQNKQTLIDIFLNKVIVYSDHVEVYLNILPSMMCEDYGLDIDTGLLKNKKEGDNLSSSLPINKNCEHNSVSTKILGSGERIRTFDLAVNSRLLHRWATPEYQRLL